MRIMIVDDDATIRSTVAARVKKLGHEPVLAEDGEQGLALLATASPDVVITDWVMPNMNGLELTRRIRMAKRPDYTYIVVLTSKNREENYFEAMNAGADDFASKPVEQAELELRIGVAARIISLRREVGQLQSLLPMCPRCKRIHTEEGTWEQVESYLSHRTSAQFSHGVCPQCFESIMKPMLEDFKKSQAKMGS